MKFEKRELATTAGPYTWKGTSELKPTETVQKNLLKNLMKTAHKFD